MDDPERLPFDELRNWLKYYRALGFTHLYGNPAVQPGLAEEHPLPTVNPVPVEERRLSGQAAPPGPPSHVARVTRPRTPAPKPDDSALAPPLVAKRASLFDGLAPRETLEKIREDLGDGHRCKLWNGRKTIVFGSGNPQAELLFVGEGPGADEDEQGLPFVGRAGQLLTQMIEKGLKIPRPKVYICNIIKCRPPGNRKPERDEIAACRQFVERQIDSVQPRAIVALGATAVETLLGTRQSMGSQRGRWHEFHGIPLMVTYHPAFLLRDPNRKPDAWEDLKKVLALLQSPAGGKQGRTAPEKTSG